MKVFILSMGETHYGGSPMAVAFNKQLLVEKVGRLAPSSGSGGHEWRKVDDDRWECGCDYVQIDELDAEDQPAYQMPEWKRKVCEQILSQPLDDGSYVDQP